MAIPYTICSLQLTAIEGADCIGDSRIYINDNFTNLAQNFCTLFNGVTSLSGSSDTLVLQASAFVKSLSAKDSPTIDLSFNPNTYFLSADVVDGSLNTDKLGGNITTFGKNLLTSTSISLTGLNDVEISSPSLDQVIRWNGSKWVNSLFAEVTGLLTDGTKGEITVSLAGENWTINSGAVTDVKLSDSSVTEAKIVDGAVSESKIRGSSNDVNDSTRSVTSDKIRLGAITRSKIALAAIDETRIDNSAVTTAKLQTANSVATGVTDIKLRHSAGLSVIGRNTNSTGAPADIIATNPNTVLIRIGNNLQFGTVPNEATTGVATNTASTLVLRDTFGNFSSNVITASQFTGNLQGNVTGNITADTGIFNTSIQTNTITSSGATSLKLITNSITRLFVNSGGNIGIGTENLTPNALFTVGRSFLGGTALSDIFVVNSGRIGDGANNFLRLGNFGFTTTAGENCSISLRAFRSTAGTDTNGTGICLDYAIGNNHAVNNAGIFLSSNGNVGIGGVGTLNERLTINGTAEILGTYLRIKGNAPTIVLSNPATNQRSAYIHVANNLLYFLAGPTNGAYGEWFGQPHPLYINLQNNYAIFGGGVESPCFVQSNNNYVDFATLERTFNANVQQLVRWVTGTPNNRTINIDNLSAGKKITIFHENNNSNSRNVFVKARTNTSDAYQNVEIAGNKRLQPSVSIPGQSGGLPGVVVIQVVNFGGAILAYELSR